MTQPVASACKTLRNVDTVSRISCVDPDHAPCAPELSANLRQAVQDGIDSGPAIPAEWVFAEMNARYAGHHA